MVVVSEHPRTVPVDPPVHVEQFVDRCSLTWRAGPLAPFLAALGELASVSGTSPVVVDATDAAGRRRHSLSTVAATGTERYVRVDPPGPWSVAWERRTSPVVSVGGTPDPAVCRRLHRETTDAGAWSDDARATLRAVVESIR